MKFDKRKIILCASLLLNAFLCLCLLAMAIHYETFQAIYHKLETGGVYLPSLRAFTGK